QFWFQTLPKLILSSGASLVAFTSFPNSLIFSFPLPVWLTLPVRLAPLPKLNKLTIPPLFYKAQP
ncbi:hypothetical protein HMPREF9072_01137, partial [Capnocytophaga sp. oral taxon 324 str. F0483]